MQQSFEDILREKMGQPVSVKGKDAQIMPMEAMVLSVMNDAMKGSIQAITFIRQLTEGRAQDSEADRVEREKVRDAMVGELQKELRAAGLPAEVTEELRLLAVEAITLRRIAGQLLSGSHTDIVSRPAAGGADKQELSITNRLYTDLRKQWTAAWQQYRQQLFNREVQRQAMKR